MSNVLAIAAVTQLLKDLLNDALINGDVGQALEADFTVTALPPDRVVAENSDVQTPQLNLFLHRVTPNVAMRNLDLPTRDASGRLTARPRLALDLHYMLTALAGEELQAEILLGYAMQLFHETAILSRETIRAALSTLPHVPDDAVLPGPIGVIRASEIADQIELLKITPRTISMDDMSRMWTALQASYRTTVAYDVSLVLIEREADRQQVMRFGRELRLLGHGLDRGDARVRFAEPGATAALELAPVPPATANRLLVRLPSGAPLAATHPLAGTGADPGAWRIGVYTVLVRLTEPSGRETLTNALPVALAPATTSAAAPVPGATAITMTTEPRIRPGQSVAILLGQRMALVPSPGAPADQAQAEFTGLASGAVLPVRLRVDGVDSPVIDRLAEPPVLETVTIP